MTVRHRTMRSQAGFTLVEMMVSTAVMMVIVAGVFSLLNPSYGTFQAQPEVADMQQRLRVSADAVQNPLPDVPVQVQQQIPHRILVGVCPHPDLFRRKFLHAALDAAHELH